MGRIGLARSVAIRGKKKGEKAAVVDNTLLAPRGDEPAVMRIHRFPISVATYHALGKRNVFPDMNDCPQPRCPHRGRLWRHGFYTRRAFTPAEVFIIVIQRYLCPMCGRTVSLLPSFVTSRFQYTLAALFWLLHSVYVVGRSTRGTVEAWRAAGGCPELNRQHLQFLVRRLQRQAAV